MGNEVDQHESHECLGVGHVVSSITVVRCGHRESYTLHGWSNVQADDEHVETLHSSSTDFGPFDTIDEVKGAAKALIASLVHVQAQYPL